MTRPILGMVAALCPLWLVAPPALSLQPLAERTRGFEQRVIAQTRLSQYVEMPYTVCDRMGIPANFCQQWMQEIDNYYYLWTGATPESLVSRLKRLNLYNRSRLGQYAAWELDWQDQRLRKLRIRPEVVDRFTDKRFYQLFPERSRKILQTELMTSQIWFAIRANETARLEANARRRSQLLPSVRRRYQRYSLCFSRRCRQIPR